MAAPRPRLPTVALAVALASAAAAHPAQGDAPRLRFVAPRTATRPSVAPLRRPATRPALSRRIDLRAAATRTDRRDADNAEHPAATATATAAAERHAAVEARIYDRVAAAARAYPSTIEHIETQGNHVERLSVGGAAIGEEFYDAIVSAEHEVFLDTMIMQDSHLAARVREAVQHLARTRPWVAVHVMVQSFRPPNERTAIGTLFTSRAATIETVRRYFGTPNVRAAAWNARAVGARLSLGRLLGLHVIHSKGLVVDNRRVVVTDSNLQTAVDPLEQGGLGWFQTAFVIEGPLAASMREEHVSAWRQAAPDVALPEPPSAHPGFADGTRALALGQEGGSMGESSANQAFLAAFGAGERRILGLSPNLNDRATVRALADATARGDVYLVLSRGFNELAEHLPGQGGGNDANVRRLAAMAANPSRLHVRWFPGPDEADGKAPRAVEGNGAGANHAKTIAIGPLVLASSKNLDTQAAQRSREAGVALFDRAAAAAFYRTFRAIWTRAPVAFDGSAARR